ncbi:glycosyltransferase family 2 protein [Patescibacteria group bacterium]|nr:glycosyltransferase family 2 protein [Patescibacteria group bacterium]
MKKTAIILINYKDYAEKYLPDCIESIRKQDCKNYKIFIVDNETSEKSFNYLNKIVPEAEIIRNRNNDGFAKGNNDAIKKAIEQKFNYVILFNLDVIVEQWCVNELIKVAESDDKISAVQARIMLWSEKEKINSLGNITHFLGFGYCSNYQDSLNSSQKKCSFVSFPRTRESSHNSTKLDSRVRGNDNLEAFRNSRDICYFSGSAVLLKVNILKQIGLFDEEFWMYNEDQDLGWRIWLAGYKCVLAQDAVVYHKYEFSRSIKKYYWMDRNRIIAIIKNYNILTLLLISPAFIIMEFGLILFSLKTGWFKEKVRVWKYFLTPAKWKYLYYACKQSQSLRKIKDKKIIKLFTGKIWYQEINDWKLKVINPVFGLYWRIVNRMIWW